MLNQQVSIHTTDHGIHKKSHGERQKDYTFVVNSGRGPLFFEFREHLLNNAANHLAEAKLNNNLPLKITVAISQSKKSGIQDFQKQIHAIQQRFPAEQVAIRAYNMSLLPLSKQLEVAAGTNIYISVMGNGAMPAFFLPRGASLVLFYNDNSEFVSVSKRQVSFPIKLDWDLWNNLSYLRVQWKPLATKDNDNDLNLLLEMIEGELQSLLEKEMSKGIDPAAQPGESDGLFNGMDVRFVDRNRTSSAHCLGDNFQERAHVLRSCHFQHICLDLSPGHRNFSLAASGGHTQLLNSDDQWMNHSALVPTSTKPAVSLGQTVRFSEDNAWFPLLSNTPLSSFYELSNDVVWLPFYAEQPNINNPGHLLWDYFLPFFNLLAMFDLEGLPLLLSNVDDGCTSEESSPCWTLLTKFLPLLGVDPGTFRNTAHGELKINGPRRSNTVCARHAVAGIGMLTDHGWNRHGQRFEDYKDAHNSGRGPFFFAFRNYVTHSMKINEEVSLGRPHKVVFSTYSSKNPSRRLGFQKQIQTLRNAFSSDEVVVEDYILSELPLEKQVKLATETAVFVSVVGGSACTATFLPRGSSVILFFNDVNEFVDHAPRKDFPSMIDWDFFNNASYLRVHWLPLSTMDGELDLKVLTEIIRTDLMTLESVQEEEV